MTTLQLTGHKYYTVSDEGDIYTEYMDGRIMPLVARENNRGYLRVRISGKEYLVHRIVAETFIPNPRALKTVNHKNLNKHDNRVGNLEWMSHSDNIRHYHLTKNL